MITLYGFGAGFGLPEISPFVTKTRSSSDGRAWPIANKRAMPPASPKGQMPYIDDEGRKHRRFDLHSRAYRAEIRLRFRRGLGQREARAAWAVRAHDRAPCLLGIDRRAWVDPDNFAKGPAHFFDGAPEDPPRKAQGRARVRVAENIFLSGLGRHAPDDDVDLAVRSLYALSLQIGDKPYLMGDKPCGIDATAVRRARRDPDAVLRVQAAVAGGAA